MPLKQNEQRASMINTVFVGIVTGTFTCLLTYFLTKHSDRTNRLFAEQSALSREQKQNVAQFQTLVKRVNEDLSTHDFDAFHKDASDFRRAVDEKAYSKDLGL